MLQKLRAKLEQDCNTDDQMTFYQSAIHAFEVWELLVTVTVVAIVMISIS